jgi:hypothetical protein
MQAFISYSVSDAILANAVHGYLRVNKINAVKAPDDIPPGADWAASIAQLIEESDYFVLLWTHNSMASKEVSKELTLAMDYGARIIPFRAEDLSPEGAWRYHLMNVQWLEAHSMPEASALETLVSYFTKVQPPGEQRVEDLDEIAQQSSLDYGSSAPEPLTIETDLGHSDVLDINPPVVSTACAEGGVNTRNTIHSAEFPSPQSSNFSESIFSIAVEIGRSLYGDAVDNASLVSSSRGLLGYQLRDETGRSIARVPWEMIESRSRGETQTVPEDASRKTDASPGAKQANTALFRTAIAVARILGNTKLESASEEKSFKGYFNYSIRDQSGHVIAEVPVSMIRARLRKC